MNLLGKAGMVFLIVLNTITLVLGLAILIVGAILYSNTNVLSGDIRTLLEAITIGSMNLYQIVQLICIVVICVGVFIMLISLTGDIGACCKLRPLLVIYAVVVIIILILELLIISLAIYMIVELNNSIKNSLLDLLSSYEGNSGGALTSAWNFLFYLFQCCGINDQASTNDFTSTTWVTGGSAGSDVIPTWCCVGVNATYAASASGDTCATSPTSSTAYINSGCYSTLNNLLTSFATALLVIGIILFLIEGAGVVFSFIMVYQITDDIKKAKVV